MKAAKHTLIVCWIITVVSLGAMVVIHTGIDIRIQEIITKTTYCYNLEEREFYQSIFSNIFTGSVVSVFTTYVSYFHQKNDVEFKFKMSELLLALKFGLLASPMYAVDLNDSQNNHAAIARFSNEIAETHEQYNRMIEANNDYSPFFKTKKVKTLQNGKLLLTKAWAEICGVEDDILVYESLDSIKASIDETRAKTSAHYEQFKKLYEDLDKYHGVTRVITSKVNEINNT